MIFCFGAVDFSNFVLYNDSFLITSYFALLSSSSIFSQLAVPVKANAE